jgi:hypothetical protein
MDCPVCKAADAYVGLQEVECVNPNCQNFSECWLRQHMRKQSDQKESRDEKTVIYETDADGAMYPLNRYRSPFSWSGHPDPEFWSVRNGGPGDAHQSNQTDGN